MRYMVNFGAPLDMTTKQSLEDETKKGERYRDYTDRNAEQKKYVNEFQLEILKTLEELNEKNKDGGIEAVITSNAIR